MPPAWASSRLKLTQLFYKHRLEPPADVIESASYLVTLTFLRQRGCVALLAQDVAQHLQAQLQARTLRLPVPIELPPVGIILQRGGLRTPACNRLLDQLREGARQRGKANRKTRGRARGH